MFIFDAFFFIARPTRCTFLYVFILKFALYMFRTDTTFIIKNSRNAVYTAVCTYRAEYIIIAVLKIHCHIFVLK